MDPEPVSYYGARPPNRGPYVNRARCPLAPLCSSDWHQIESIWSLETIPVKSRWFITSSVFCPLHLCLHAGNLDLGLTRLLLSSRCSGDWLEKRPGCWAVIPMLMSVLGQVEGLLTSSMTGWKPRVDHHGPHGQQIKRGCRQHCGQHNFNPASCLLRNGKKLVPPPFCLFMEYAAVGGHYGEFQSPLLSSLQESCGTLGGGHPFFSIPAS